MAWRWVKGWIDKESVSVDILERGASVIGEARIRGEVGNNAAAQANWISRLD